MIGTFIMFVTAIVVAIVCYSFGYLTEKTEDMLIAETIWDAIRCARGHSKWGQPLVLGGEPCPKIEKEEQNDN